MRTRVLTVAATLAALLAADPPALAQGADPARLAAAREMMAVAGVSKQFDEVMPMLAEQLSRGFIAVAPDKATEIREVFSQLATRFIDRKGELIEQIAALYADQLTADELAGVVAFYRSPAGVKFMTIQPQIMRQSMALGQRWGAQIGREIEQEARRELKRRGIDL